MIEKTMLNLEVSRKKESTEFWLILVKFQIFQQKKLLENVTRIYHMFYRSLLQRATLIKLGW